MMGSYKQDGTPYEYRSYIHEIIQPKKHQVTAIALKYLRQFIQEAFAPPIKKEPTEAGDVKLSKSENKVFFYLAQGFDTKETAKILGMGLSTVQSYVSRVYGKYGVKDRQKAIERYLKEKANEQL